MGLKCNWLKRRKPTRRSPLLPIPSQINSERSDSTWKPPNKRRVQFWRNTSAQLENSTRPNREAKPPKPPSRNRDREPVLRRQQVRLQEPAPSLACERQAAKTEHPNN